MRMLVFPIVVVVAMTLLVQASWNIGLYGADIVHNTINFWTALGLLGCLLLIRNYIVPIPTGFHKSLMEFGRRDV